MSKVLADIQAKIKAPKDKENTFGKYKYRNAESILSAFKDVQPEGVSLTMSDEIIFVGNRLFLTATVTLRHGAEIIGQAHGAAMHATEKKGMDDAQITGACSSYARKYALCGLLAIDDSTDDPDAKDHRPPSFDAVAAHDRITRKLEASKTLADLGDAWKSEGHTIKEIEAVRADLFTALTATKDRLKADLQPKATDADA
jgi:hypothetical protein